MFWIRRNWVFAVSAILAFHLSPHESFAQPVTIRVETDMGNDTLFLERPGSIIFNVQVSEGTEIAAMKFPMLFNFTNGNIMGPIVEGSQFTYAVYAGFFEIRAFSEYYGDSVTDPDTLVWLLISDWGHGLRTSAELVRITFTPLDTGWITVDSMPSPLGSLGLEVVDQFGMLLPFDWKSATFAVVPCPVKMGDVNEDGRLSTADVVHIVSYLFRGGAGFTPRPEVGDVDCSGENAVADVVYLVDYLFRGGPPPCGCFVQFE